jgi:hypothetical protein
MSILAVQSHNESDTVEDCVSAESVDELQEANARLQLLICELLVKNQELRFRIAAE